MIVTKPWLTMPPWSNFHRGFDFKAATIITLLVCHQSSTSSSHIFDYYFWSRTHQNCAYPRPISSSSWIIQISFPRANYSQGISLTTTYYSWNRERRLVEEECEFAKPILEEFEQAGADILSTSGTVLFHLPDDPDDVDASLEAWGLEDPSNPLLRLLYVYYVNMTKTQSHVMSLNGGARGNFRYTDVLLRQTQTLLFFIFFSGADEP